LKKYGNSKWKSNLKYISEQNFTEGKVFHYLSSIIIMQCYHMQCAKLSFMVNNLKNEE